MCKGFWLANKLLQLFWTCNWYGISIFISFFFQIFNYFAIFYRYFYDFVKIIFKYFSKYSLGEKRQHNFNKNNKYIIISCYEEVILPFTLRKNFFLNVTVKIVHVWLNTGIKWSRSNTLLSCGMMRNYQGKKINMQCLQNPSFLIFSNGTKCKIWKFRVIARYFSFFLWETTYFMVQMKAWENYKQETFLLKQDN